jgi:hypothetical protein
MSNKTAQVVNIIPGIHVFVHCSGVKTAIDHFWIMNLIDIQLNNAEIGGILFSGLEFEMLVASPTGDNDRQLR